MTLLAVKGYDEANNEILSTISMTSDENQIISALPSIRKLIAKTNLSNTPQGWIYDDKCIAFLHLPSSQTLFVAIATSRTSFSKLRYFLELLGNSYEKRTLENQTGFSAKEFQDLCDYQLDQ